MVNTKLHTWGWPWSCLSPGRGAVTLRAVPTLLPGLSLLPALLHLQQEPLSSGGSRSPPSPVPAMGFGHGGNSGFVPLWLDKGTAWGWGTGMSPKSSGAGKGTAWAELLPHSPWKRGSGMATGKGPAGRDNVSPQSRHQPRPWDPPDLSNGGLKSWNGVLLPGQEQGWGRGWVAQPRADKGFAPGSPGQELLELEHLPCPVGFGLPGVPAGWLVGFGRNLVPLPWNSCPSQVPPQVALRHFGARSVCPGALVWFLHTWKVPRDSKTQSKG